MAYFILLLLVYVAFTCLGLQHSLLGAAWPSMYQGLNAQISFAGIISMIITGCIIISSIFCSKIAKKISTGITCLIGFLLIALALIGFSFSRSIMMLCLCAIPLGLGTGLEEVLLNDIVARFYKLVHMNFLHCLWGVGATIGPIILVHMGNWNWGYRIISIIELCLVVVLFFSLPLWNKITGKTIKEEEIDHKSLSYLRLFKLKGVKYALASFFFYCSIEALVGLWGSSFVVIVKGIPKDTAANWVSLFFLGITFGRLVSGFLAFKLNNRWMIRLGQILIALGIIFLVLPFGNTSLLIAFLMLGVGCGPIFPSLSHETPENFGKEYSQDIMGMQVAFAFTGSTVMPPLFGFIASHFNYGLLPVFLVSILIILIIVSEILNNKVKKNRMEIFV